jgi:hypothetical protein
VRVATDTGFEYWLGRGSDQQDAVTIRR